MEALAIGADGFRTKPLDANDLTELVGVLLQQGRIRHDEDNAPKQNDKGDAA